MAFDSVPIAKDLIAQHSLTLTEDEYKKIIEILEGCHAELVKIAL